MADVTTLPVSGSPAQSIGAPNMTPGQDWASIISSIVSGITGLKGTDINQANQAAQLADPFMGQRQQYQPMLHDLVTKPESFLQNPMFTAPLKVGSENVARQFGAAGMGMSGGQMAALQDYGQSQANSYLQQWLPELNLLSGASVGSPAAAGGILQRGQQQQTNAIGAGAAGLGSLLGPILSALGFGNGAPASVINQIIKSLGGGSGGLSGDNSGAPPTDIVPGNTPGFIGGPTDTSTLPDIVPADPTDPNFVDPNLWAGANPIDTGGIDWSSLGDLGSWFGGPG